MYREREREREKVYCWMGGARCFIPISPKDAQKSKKEKRSNFHQPHSNVPPTPPTPSKKKTFPEKERMSQIVTSNHHFSGDLIVLWGVTMASKLPQESKKNIILITLCSSMPPLHFSVELLQVSAFFQAWIGAWQWSKTHEEKPAGSWLARHRNVNCKWYAGIQRAEIKIGFNQSWVWKITGCQGYKFLLSPLPSLPRIIAHFPGLRVFVVPTLGIFPTLPCGHTTATWPTGIIWVTHAWLCCEPNRPSLNPEPNGWKYPFI